MEIKKNDDSKEGVFKRRNKKGEAKVQVNIVYANGEKYSGELVEDFPLV